MLSYSGSSLYIRNHLTNVVFCLKYPFKQGGYAWGLAYPESAVFRRVGEAVRAWVGWEPPQAPKTQQLNSPTLQSVQPLYWRACVLFSGLSDILADVNLNTATFFG